MTLLESYRAHLLTRLANADVLVIGENIDNGSKISGLGKGLETLPSAKVLNVGNCELTHAGIGMGVMLEGGHLILMVKQLDFLLLGLDQMVNTLNWIRAASPSKNLGSFSIITYICDQGFQGPQSSMVDLTGFCSLGAFPGFILQEHFQIESVFENFLLAPGFRIFGIPQKLANGLIPEISPTESDSSNGWRVYGDFGEVVIFSCHSSFAAALELRKKIHEAGSSAAVVLLDVLPQQDLTFLFGEAIQNKNCVVLDDSKGTIKWGDRVMRKLFESGRPKRCFFFDRERREEVHDDLFSLPLDEITAQLLSR